MAEHPILFSSPMVRAILEGRKSQTRRAMNPQPSHDQYHEWRGKVTRDAEHRMWCWKDLVLDNIWDFPEGEDRKTLASHCPYGVPGDRLWVRETLVHGAKGNPVPALNHVWRYAADNLPVELTRNDPRIAEMVSWAHHKEGDLCVSIHMPRWASRITLEITDVRVQRLADISESDAMDEGTGVYLEGKHDEWDGDPDQYRKGFRELWDSINAKRHPWSSNPWVWAITFRRLP